MGISVAGLVGESLRHYDVVDADFSFGFFQNAGVAEVCGDLFL